MTLILVSSNQLVSISLQIIFLILSLYNGPLQTDLMLGYPLKGMALFSSFCWF